MLIWLKKEKNYKLENIKFFESIYKNGKNSYKIWWFWNAKTKNFTNIKDLFHKNIDICKIVVSKKVSFVKEGFE